MTEITLIPLNKLAHSEDNVRKTATAQGIAEMAASIRAHGLQQNLVVRQQGKRFGVIDGGRRYAALLQLAEDGAISRNLPIPCKVDESAIDAKELSLIANTIREDMHPADQFEAFKALVDNGQSTADIAARRGCPESHVAKLLKLANCSPILLKAYREEQLSLEQLMAYAVTHDHDAQERVFQQEGDHASTFHIRRLLTRNELPGTDKRVRFVGLDAFEKGGGIVKRDLFSDDEDGVYIADVALLDKLAREKLEREADPVRKEGWKWIEVRPSFDYQERSKFQQYHAEPPPLSDELAAEVQQLQDEYDRLIDSEEEHASRLDEIDARLKHIEEARGEAVFTPEQLATAGAIVTIGHDGNTRIQRGLVRPEDVPAERESDPTPPWDTSDENPQSKTAVSEFSVGLIEYLTAHKSAAISAVLLQQPSIGLAVVVHAFVSKIFRGTSERSCFHIFCSERSFRNVEGSKALQHIEDAREQWKKRLSDTDLWQWCLAQEQQVLVDLLAFCTAVMIDAVRRKPDLPNSGRLRHGDMLALALKMDVSAWFTPTADNYFSRVSKRQILEAIFEAKGQPAAPAWERLKKPELAKEAERQVAGKGWLPKPLRVEA
ncbi:MAG TPA: ParB/RepB/Spo0J family partition protein [Bryobacteraceae bacterium]|nr:ParB/RepB/Spo0J family partition protein [Bryobacteraceae bacterium]